MTLSIDLSSMDVFLVMGSLADIEMVAVDGRLHVENRALTFIDEPALSRAFVGAVKEFAARLAA